LSRLESGDLLGSGEGPSEAPAQLGLFSPPTHPLIEELGKLDLLTTTPLRALTLLSEWQARLREPE
jgi:hypothetical protein